MIMFRSKNFRGKISLTGGHVNDTGNANKPHSFEFHVKDGDAEILELAAPSEAEKQKWLLALSSSSHSEVTKEEVPETGQSLSCPILHCTGCSFVCPFFTNIHSNSVWCDVVTCSCGARGDQAAGRPQGPA